jgi:hypothetical protein
MSAYGIRIASPCQQIAHQGWLAIFPFFPSAVGDDKSMDRAACAGEDYRTDFRLQSDSQDVRLARFERVLQYTRSFHYFYSVLTRR